jgi:hypothetical protein
MFISCCGAPARLYIFHGDVPEANCKSLVAKFHDPQTVIACPGDKVTLYFENVAEIDYGEGPKMVTSPGRLVIEPTKSVTVVAQATDKSCGPASASIEIAEDDHILTMEGRWNFAKNTIDATIPNAFVSPKLKVLAITVDPTLSYVGGTSEICLADPYLRGNTGSHTFTFPRLERTHTFPGTITLRPAGTWSFESLCASPPPTAETDWARDAIYVFELRVRCAP